MLYAINLKSNQIRLSLRRVQYNKRDKFVKYAM